MARKKYVETREPLKPNTFYFIKSNTPIEYDDIRVCKTDEDWEDWVEEEDKRRGHGFRVLGHVDDTEYLHEFPADKWQFIEIPKP
jgi:hypothetical protein